MTVLAHRFGSALRSPLETSPPDCRALRYAASSGEYAKEANA
jgi:hypothetical protein